MELKEIISRAKEIKKLYSQKEKSVSGKEWGALERTQGLVGDVGDLMKLMMAKHNLREAADVDTKLAHELSDCLWAILMIADDLGIDIEKEFTHHGFY